MMTDMLISWTNHYHHDLTMNCQEVIFHDIFAIYIATSYNLLLAANSLLFRSHMVTSPPSPWLGSRSVPLVAPTL